MYKRFPQQSYIYIGEKPEMNRGDSSIEKDSFNELKKENENDNEKEYDIISSENFFEIPKETKIPTIQIPYNDVDLFPQNKQRVFCSATKDTETAGLRLNSNIKEDNFSIKNKSKFNNENNRYININSFCKNNCLFLNSLKNEYESDDEDIVNNEISVNFCEDFVNGDDKLQKEEQFEIILNNNFSKIYNNNEIINNNIIINKNNNINNNSVNKDKIKKIKNENIFKKNEINENIKNIIQNINKNKNEWNENYEKKNINNIPLTNKDNNVSVNSFIIENKENFNRNVQYDTEININLNINQLKKSNKKQKIIEFDKKKIKNVNINDDGNQNLNNKFFEIKNIKKSINTLFKSKSSRNINISLNPKKSKSKNFLNLTKKYKIFQTFLSIGIDTSGLYTLDDEMNIFLLNPKITYNYPYNNLEKELE